LGSLYAIKQKIEKKSFFAVCKDQSTRQRMATGLPGKHLCRVLNPWHTAKVPFFAVCYGIWHTANLPCLPCVVALAHGKVALPPSAVVVDFFCRVSSYTHGKGFAVCPTKNPQQKRPLPMLGCRGTFVVCYTWQSLCRVQIGLCRVFLAHGK